MLVKIGTVSRRRKTPNRIRLRPRCKGRKAACIMARSTAKGKVFFMLWNSEDGGAEASVHSTVARWMFGTRRVRQAIPIGGRLCPAGHSVSILFYSTERQWKRVAKVRGLLIRLPKEVRWANCFQV